MRRPVFVTRPSLPPLAEVLPALEQIWATRVLSNRGPFHEELAEALATKLGAPHCALMTNGMLALESVIAVAGLTGEVVTTPYSFVATTHAVTRAGLTPVFADIDPDDFNLDPDAAERAITERTSAIVAVHCYGNPCRHERLRALADKHGLTLIYDAAHAFGVTWQGQSVAALGDLAALSFHATKAFNTFEGGAALSHSAEHHAAIELWRNFGIASETEVPAIGGNAKMNEFSAAIGLLQLGRFEDDRTARGRVDARYRRALEGVEGVSIPAIPSGVSPNFSYFPVLIDEGYPLSRDALYERMKASEVFARRYFYPLLADLPMYSDLPSAAADKLPVARRVANQVLCLPIYPDLSEEDQNRVIALLKDPG